MLFFSLQIICTNKDGEVRISYFECLDLAIEPFFDFLPDSVRGWLENIANSSQYLLKFNEDD